MDPVSILGLISSIITIGDVVAKSIRKLSDLRTKDRHAPMQITSLIGQLYIIKSVIEELKRWEADNSADFSRFRQLAMQIEPSLECFRPMILSLQQYLDDLEAFSLAGPGQPDLHDRLAYLWNETDIAMYMDLVNRQINALNLFLQAVQCTRAEQQRIMRDKESENVLKLARDCKSSILGIADRSSLISDNTNGLSVQFDFDSIVLGSKVYQTAHRSHVKQIIKAHRANPAFEGGTSSRTIMWDEKPEPGFKRSETAEDDMGGGATTNNGNRALASELLNGNLKPAISDPDHMGNTPSPLVTTEDDGQGTVTTARIKPIADAGLSMALQHVSPLTGQKTTLRDRLRSGPLAAFRDAQRKRRKISQGVKNKAVSTVDWHEQEPEHSVLLLGTSESGKSTVRKILKLLFEGAFTEEQCENFNHVIRYNVVFGTRAVLEAMESLQMSLSDVRNECHVETILRQYFSKLSALGPFPPAVCEAIQILWKDQGFLEAYRRHHGYQLSPSLAAFAQDITRIASDEYIASEEDVLRSYVRTSGVAEFTFSIGPGRQRARFYDVGGFKSERKYWLHVLENVDTIVFTVDATCYCKGLAEDRTVDRMQEALKLFDNIANGRWITRTRLLLVFTHLDQLDETISRRPICDYFPDFEAGWNEKRRYMRYLEQQFLSRVRHDDKRRATRAVWTDLINGDRERLGDDILEAINTT